MRFILLCGPPGSGKSTIARMLCEQLEVWHRLRVTKDSFAAPMKHYIATALGEKYEEMDKDSQHPVLNGYSPRNFLISLSEDHMKPRYGSDIFGRLLYHRALRYTPKPDWIIVDDSGFAPEAEALGEFDPITVEVHRPEKTFEFDSRSYWMIYPDYQIVNNGDFDFLKATVNALAVDIAGPIPK